MASRPPNIYHPPDTRGGFRNPHRKLWTNEFRHNICRDWVERKTCRFGSHCIDAHLGEQGQTLNEAQIRMMKCFTEE